MGRSAHRCIAIHIQKIGKQTRWSSADVCLVPNRLEWEDCLNCWCLFGPWREEQETRRRENPAFPRLLLSGYHVTVYRVTMATAVFVFRQLPPRRLHAVAREPGTPRAFASHHTGRSSQGQNTKSFLFIFNENLTRDWIVLFICTNRY